MVIGCERKCDRSYVVYYCEPVWLIFVHSYGGKLYSEPYEGREAEVWQLKDIYRALPWPQGPLPTDSRQLRKLGRVARGDLDKPLNVKLRRPGHTPLIHMACSVIESREPNDASLYCSEIICAPSIMTDHMERGRFYWDYGIFPVCVTRS